MSARAGLDVSCAIMSRPRRDSTVETLLRDLAPLRPVVVEDRGSPWATARAAWAAQRPEATHHLVLQDDVRLVRGFVRGLEDMVAAAPTCALALYASWYWGNGFRVRMTALGGGGLVRASLREWVPTVALLLPAGLAAEVAALTETDEHDDDEVLAALLHERRPTPVLVAVPNLAEHADDPAVGVGGYHGLRRSACFLTDYLPRTEATLVATGPDWEEPAVYFKDGVAIVDWGIRVHGDPSRHRRILAPWHEVVRFSGLGALEVDRECHGIAGEYGHVSAGAARFVREYAVACFLHGLAWSLWWSGRHARPLERSAVADESLLSLARAGATPDDRRAIADDSLLEVGWRALAAGHRRSASLGRRSSATTFYRRLAAYTW